MAAEGKHSTVLPGAWDPAEHKRLKNTRHTEDESQALLCGEQT